MMRVDRAAKVYLAVGATDLRKAINGLSILAQQQMGQDPFGGGYFAFSNRARNRIKVLYWDRNGFCLWQKRLERDRFRWPKDAAEVVELDGRQLEWLLSGLDVSDAHTEVKYSRVI
jgi:transposase